MPIREPWRPQRYIREDIERFSWDVLEGWDLEEVDPYAPLIWEPLEEQIRVGDWVRILNDGSGTDFPHWLKVGSIGKVRQLGRPMFNDIVIEGQQRNEDRVIVQTVSRLSIEVLK